MREWKKFIEMNKYLTYRTKHEYNVICYRTKHVQNLLLLIINMFIALLRNVCEIGEKHGCRGI